MKTATQAAQGTGARGISRGAPFSPSVMSGLVAVTDAAVVFVIGAAVYAIYVGWGEERSPMYLSALAVQVFMTVTAFHFAGLYRFDALAQPVDQIKKILLICATVFLVLIALAYAFKISSDFSRVWAFASFALGSGLLCLNRPIWLALLRRWSRAGVLTRNIVIVGGGDQARKLLQQLRSGDEPWNRVLAIFDDRVARIGPSVMGCPVRGTLRDLPGFARAHRVDDVILALPWNADRRLVEIVRELATLPVNLRLGSDLVGFVYPARGYSFIGGAMTMDIARKPLAGWRIAVKQLEDKILASGLLLAALPLMAVIALAIRLESPGPVIFWQRRAGFNEAGFWMAKFRTMRHDPAAPPLPARRDDPRVTRVGRFLRRASLDELPQLFNVLRGTMSLVGPRPHAVEQNQEYARSFGAYIGRHRVKPGITGWAQVHGFRGEADTPEKIKARVEHDIHYIENWSLGLDLRILIMTVFVVLTQKNAY